MSDRKKGGNFHWDGGLSSIIDLVIILFVLQTLLYGFGGVED